MKAFGEVPCGQAGRLLTPRAPAGFVDAAIPAGPSTPRVLLRAWDCAPGNRRGRSGSAKASLLQALVAKADGLAGGRSLAGPDIQPGSV